MSQSSSEAVPSVRSRHPRSAAKQAELDSANNWITSESLVASTCPISTIIEIIATDTAVGKTVLSKYDPAALQSLHGMMPATERRDIVEDLRKDVCLRQARAQKWRHMMAILAAEQSTTECKDKEAWETLDSACKYALQNTEQLQARLVWCEQNFESVELEHAVAAKQRAWDDGAETGSSEEERGRSMSRQ